MLGPIVRTDELVERSKGLPFPSTHSVPNSGMLHDQLNEREARSNSVDEEALRVIDLSAAMVKEPEGLT